MENWEKAMLLERFIRYYIPKGWKEEVYRVDFVPYVSVADYLFFEVAYQGGYLLDCLKTYGELSFRKHYVMSAIEEYFRKEEKNEGQS